jgi:hypothetical protein
MDPGTRQIIRDLERRTHGARAPARRHAATSG